MFVVAGNGGPHVLVNEIARAGAQFGQLALDGTSISQFDSTYGDRRLPLGKPVRAWRGDHDQPYRR